MTPRWRRWLAAALLIGTGACNEVSCWWTDDPNEPWTPTQPNRRYRSDAGQFDVVLGTDGPWPPTVGTTSVTIEGRAVDPQADTTPELTADRPYLYDDEGLTAELDPVVVPLAPLRWRIDQLELDAPGRWVVPLTLEGSELDDSIDLGVEVEGD